MMAYRLYAFGSNGEGQLGLGYASDKVLVPTQISNTPAFLDKRCHLAICSGGNHTLIHAPNGTVWGAGRNQNGQLGFMPQQDTTNTGQENNNRVMEFQEGYSNVEFCAAAWESSAYILRSDVFNYKSRGVLNTAAFIHTEGRELYGELGLAEREDSLFSELEHQTGEWDKRLVDTPKTSVPGSPLLFAAGMYHYVATMAHGSVWGWGRARNGQLGETKEASLSKPTEISVPFHPRGIACGQNFTYLAGDSSTGEHIVLGGDRHGIQSKKPAHIKGWKAVGATWNAIFVLFEDGSLTAWGKEDLWQLVPPGLPLIQEIAVGSDHVLARTREGKVLAWGWAVHGNCGDTSKLARPLTKGYVTGQFNEIELEGDVVTLGAGYSTSFVMVRGKGFDNHGL